MYINQTPDNVNQLQNNRFKATIPTVPNVNFFMQSFTIPGVKLPSVKTPTPFINRPVGGDKPDFDPLIITFAVQEDMENYFELYRWIYQVGFPRSYEDYTKLDATDVTVTSYTSAQNPNIDMIFFNVIPTALTGFEFKTTSNNIDYVSASVTFEFESFSVQRRDRSGSQREKLL